MPPTHPSSPAVRAATDDDYPAIMALVTSTRLFGFLNRTVWRESIEKGELNISLYRGILTGCIRFHKRRDDKTTIYDLYVVPAYRRRGHGTLLFNSIPTPKQLKCPNHAPYAGAHAFYAHLNPTLATSVYDMTLYVWADPT
jgi:GNAT superfamily N-acetyltransferase